MMIRNIFAFVVVALFLVGFAGTVSAQQEEDGFQVVTDSSRYLSQTTQTKSQKTQPTGQIEKGQVDKPVPVSPKAPCPRGKVKKKVGRQCYCVAVDNVARADNKRQDEELGALRDQVSGPNGLVKIVGDVDKNSKDRDAELQKAVDSKASKEEVAASANHDNLWWWIWVIGIGTLLALIAAIIGWFLPRGHTHVNDAPAGNTPAAATATAHTHTQETPLGLTGNNPPAAPAAPLAAAAPMVAAAPIVVRPNAEQTAYEPTNLRPATVVAPGPRIDSVSNSVLPNMVPTTGGWPMTLKGGGFMPNAKVYFGDTLATEVQFIDVYTLIATAPEGSSGDTDVKVVNPDGREIIRRNAIRYF